MRAKARTCHCGEPSLPASRGVGELCQYHFNVRFYGQKWADQERDNPGDSQSDDSESCTDWILLFDND